MAAVVIKLVGVSQVKPIDGFAGPFAGAGFTKGLNLRFFSQIST